MKIEVLLNEAVRDYTIAEARRMAEQARALAVALEEGTDPIAEAHARMLTLIEEAGKVATAIRESGSAAASASAGFVEEALQLAKIADRLEREKLAGIPAKEAELTIKS